MAIIIIIGNELTQDFQVQTQIHMEISREISWDVPYVKPNLSWFVRLRNTKTLCAELLRGVGGLLLDRTGLPKSGQGYGLCMGYGWVVYK